MSVDRKMHYIYKITFPDGKYYIGCTCNIKARLACHFNKPYSNSKVSKHMIDKGYSKSDVKIEVLRELMYRSIAKRIERGILLHNYHDQYLLNNPRFKEKRVVYEVKMPNGEIKHV